MKAAVYYGPADIRVEEQPERIPTEDNMIVEIHACAVCGTDLKLATIGNPRYHPPRIIGHEIIAHITHVGKNVHGFAPGERVTFATTLACGECEVCHLGLQNICPNRTPISNDFDGGFTTHMEVPPMAISGDNVIKVPDSVPDEMAALSEPLSCVINALEIAGLKPGDSILIIGGGPLGALHANAARAMGANEIMIVQRSEPRLSLLRRLIGVTVIDGKNEDVMAVVQERTNGMGADVVSVCAPNREAQQEAMAHARLGGSISLFASLPSGDSEITIDTRTLHYGELRLVGASDSRPEHVRRAVEFMQAGYIEADKIITHRVLLEDIHQGFELMKRKESLKVVVYPSAKYLPQQP
jgi:L-iditol 2-dehydrogenase